MIWGKCVRNNRYLLINLEIVEILTFCIDQIYNIVWNCSIFEQKFKDVVEYKKLHKNIFRKIHERRHKCKKKWVHKLVFFTELYDHRKWGFVTIAPRKIALSIWDDKFSDTKACKFIIENNIVARNSKHADLSGDQSTNYKSSIQE